VEVTPVTVPEPARSSPHPPARSSFFVSSTRLTLGSLDEELQKNSFQPGVNGVSGASA